MVTRPCTTIVASPEGSPHERASKSDAAAAAAAARGAAGPLARPGPPHHRALGRPSLPTRPRRRRQGSIAVAISEARLRLAEIEHATRRLDDRSYGRCFACLTTIPIPALLDEPAARYCSDCSETAASSMTSRTAGVG